ncbi:MAG: tyrosine-type recombinase/integrase [Thermovirgaceae bacterium]
MKSKRPREFPMTAELRACIESAGSNLTPCVFVYAITGKPYDKSINRIWNRAVKSLGLEPRHVPLYSSTRHSFGCLMLAAGVDCEVVSKWLDHGNQQITRRYAAHETVTLAGIVGKVQRLPQQPPNSKTGGYLEG